MYMFSFIYIWLDFHKYVLHKATVQYRRFKILIPYLKSIEMHRCSSWTLIVCHYVLLVPYFCQWLHYDMQPLKSKNLLKS